MKKTIKGYNHRRINLKILLFFVILIAVLLISLLYSHNLFIKEENFPPIKFLRLTNLRFKHFNNLVLIEFDLKNNQEKPLMCDALIFVYNNTNELLRFNTTLGILPPDVTTTFVIPKELPSGKTRIVVKPKCELLNESINETIKELITKTSLKQCNYDNIGELDQKVFCVAFLKGNLTYCNYMISDYRRKHCFAILTKDPSFCEEIQTTTGKDWCFKDLAVNFVRIDLCDKIMDKATRGSCYSILTNNITQCLDIEDINEKYYCVTMLAIKQKNVNLCDKLQGLNNLTNECKKEARSSFI